MQSTPVFLDIKKLLICSEKRLMLAEIRKGCVLWFISFLNLL